MTRPSALAAVAAAVLVVPLFAPSVARAGRALGVDVYSGQNVSSWSTVQSAGVSFVFMKATEGATFNDSVYDFRDNAIRKTSTLLFSPYHFARPNSNTAIVEANHFFNVAGKSMRAGNLLPVLDLEDGSTMTASALTTWATGFSDQLYKLAGVRPIIYVSGDYARNQLTSAVNTLDLWYANPGYSVTSAQNNFDATSDYGVWNGVPNAKSGSATAAEWSFWQYNWKGEVAGIDGIAAGSGIKANTTSDLDLDVANGDIEYVKKFKIPAIYQSDADGAFGDTSKWNTNYYDRDAAVTVYGLPTLTDRIRIDRAAANPLVTVSASDRVGQSLDLADRLAIVSGSLTLAEYANVVGNATVAGGTLNVGTTTTIGSASTVTVSSGAFNAAGAVTNAGTLNVSGGTFAAPSIASSKALNVSGGVTTISGAISGAGTTAVTGGQFTAASLTQAAVTVNGGTLNVTGLLSSTGAINVGGTGSLSAGSITQGTLAIAGTGTAKLTGMGGSKVTGLSVASTASLNLGLAKLAVDYTGTSPASSVVASIAAGAIRSDKAIANTTGVGYAESAQFYGGTFTGTKAWNGVSVDATSLLLSLALFGDANLNGTVDVVDLGALATHYGQSGNWAAGDSNYDGVIDVVDLGAIATNYGRTLNADGTVTSADPAAFQAAMASFPALVPEPTSLAAVAGLAGVALRRRRR